MTELSLPQRQEIAEVTAMLVCPGCSGSISARYAPYGVCRDCYGTTDDPYVFREGGQT